MPVWTVANQKGGVGKTTTAVTLASMLAERGNDTLLIDLDPHASATAYLLRGKPAPGRGVISVFDAAADGRAIDLAAEAGASLQEGLYVLGASPALAAVERRLGGKEGMGRALGRAVEGSLRRFPAVVIDCPPTLGLLMVSALAVAEHVIVPVQSEPLALEGLRRMMSTLEMVGRTQGRHIPRTIVTTLYDQRTRAGRDALQSLRDSYADALWPGVVPVDTRLRDASREGLPAPVFCPGSRAVAAYAELFSALDGHAARSSPAPESRRAAS